MAKVTILSSRDLTKGISSDVFDVPAFTVSQVTIDLDGEVAKALEKDSVFHAQMVKALNDHLDDVHDTVAEFLKKQEAKADAIMAKPADPDVQAKLKSVQDLVDEGNAMLKKAAAALDDGVEEVLQKTFDTYVARNKLNLKYKLTVALKSTLAAVAIITTVARMILSSGVDITAYLSLMRQVMKVMKLIDEAAKDCDDVAEELNAMMDELSTDIEKEVTKTTKQLAKEGAAAIAAAILPIMSGEMATIKTARTKCDQLSSKLTDVDKNCRTLLADAEKSMKEIKKIESTPDGKDSSEVKELGKQTSSLLDEIGSLQADLAPKWKSQEAIAKQLAEWEAKRAKFVQYTPVAVGLASKAQTAYKCVTRAMEIAAEFS